MGKKAVAELSQRSLGVGMEPFITLSAIEQKPLDQGLRDGSLSRVE